MALSSQNVHAACLDNIADLPRCRKCKKKLDTSSDHMKTRNKWWTNCQSCRTTNTTKWRAKRDAGLIPGRRGEQQRPIFTKRNLDTDTDTRTENTKTHKDLPSPSHDSERWLGWDTENVDEKCPVCQQRPCQCLRSTSTPTWDYETYMCRDDFEDDTLQDRDATSEGPDMSECSVCGESFLGNEIVDLAACLHHPDVCKECFVRWLESQLDSTSWEKVQCPSSRCDQPICHNDVKKYASDELFTRFDELSMVAFLSADPNFRYCLAEGCKSGQIHDNSTEGNIFRCNVCNFRVCTVHDVSFHTGETCAHYDKRRREEEEQSRKEDEERQEQNRMSLAEVKESTTKCPGCEVPIHKFEACDHMTCSRCQFQFCYICRAPYQGKDGIWIAGNKAHTTDCKYHSLKLPDYAPPSDDEVLLLDDYTD